ncbi:MAG: AIR carboxylase family protein [Chromatiales bacterium]|nr:AIR carboxylase family protein [Chromatiales bacterium]
MQHAAARCSRRSASPHEARVVSGAPHARRHVRVRRGRARPAGCACIIAGAGGAAHLPGMLAAKTAVPVLGVPVPSQATCAARTRCCRSCRCPRASRWRPSPSARPGAANAGAVRGGDARRHRRRRSRASSPRSARSRPSRRAR